MNGELVFAVNWYVAEFKLDNANGDGIDDIVQLSGHAESIVEIIVDRAIDYVTDPPP